MQNVACTPLNASPLLAYRPPTFFLRADAVKTFPSHLVQPQLHHAHLEARPSQTPKPQRQTHAHTRMGWRCSFVRESIAEWI